MTITYSIGVWHSIEIGSMLFLNGWGHLPLNVSRTVKCHVNRMTVPLIESHAIHHMKCSNSYPGPFYEEKKTIDKNVATSFD